MIAAMPDEQQMGIAERFPAVCAFGGVVQPAWLQRLPRFPVRSLHRPRHHVLEAAEDRTPIAGVLPIRGKAEPVAVVGFHRIAAPGTGEPFCPRHVRACPSR